MNIISGKTYHIYNQGNNQEKIFTCHDDYVQFQNLVRRFVFPYCKILAYCLMPNYFHFLIYATNESEKKIKIGNIELCNLSNGFRLLQSNYASNFNKKYDRSGSLFRQKTKAKSTTEGLDDYSFIAFQYIHQNPFKAGLVIRIEDWIYSSFPDYLQGRKDTLCDQNLCFDLIGFDREHFLSESYRMIDVSSIEKIFQ